MKIHLKTIKKLYNNNGYVASVLIALIVASVFVASYYVLLKPPQKGYMTIYLLDSQKKALNYPELLVINQNDTKVWVVVKNHMGKSQYSEILLKITSDTIHVFPFEANAKTRYTKTLEDGEIWETLSPISIDKPGIYSLIFELWVYDEEAKELKFSGNVCVLNVKVMG